MNHTPQYLGVGLMALLTYFYLFYLFILVKKGCDTSNEFCINIVGYLRMKKSLVCQRTRDAMLMLYL